MAVAYIHNAPKAGLDTPCEPQNSRARALPSGAPGLRLRVLLVLGGGGGGAVFKKFG
jgi:hypothetical protein